MTEQSKAKTKNVVSPVARASYVHVWEMEELPSGVMGHSISLIFKKDEPGLAGIKKSIEQAAINKFGADKSKWPKPFWNPLRDGDEDRDEKIYEGCVYLSPKSTRKVGVVGPDAKPIMDQDEFYSGCYCRASLNFYGFDNKGKRGVGVGLNNVMKIKDGDRLDGKVNAEAEFAEFATEVVAEEGESFLD